MTKLKFLTGAGSRRVVQNVLSLTQIAQCWAMTASWTEVQVQVQMAKHYVYNSWIY